MNTDDIRAWMLSTGVIEEATYQEEDGRFVAYWNHQFWALRPRSIMHLIECPVEDLPKFMAAHPDAGPWVALAAWRLEHE